MPQFVNIIISIIPAAEFIPQFWFNQIVLLAIKINLKRNKN